MGESNTVVSAYTLYRHLRQYCSHLLNYAHHITNTRNLKFLAHGHSHKISRASSADSAKDLRHGPSGYEFYKL